MKNIYGLTTIILMAVSITSCSFLDENMNTRYSEEDIYGSKPALESAIIGCYTAFATSGFYGGAMMEWFSPASAIVHWGLTGSTLSDPQKRWLDNLSLTQFSKNPYNLSMYKNLYGTVYKCNKLISAMPSSPVEQEFKDQIEAEAHFLRAEAYFHIVRRWGNVPIHSEIPVTLEQTNGKREPFWKVYGLILNDLDYAYSHGSKDGHYGTGRVGRHAAMAVKSLVYLTIGTLLEHSDADDNFWVCSNEEVFAGFASIGIESAKDAFEKALEAAKDVMPETSETGSPYMLAENYSQLFKWTAPEDYQLKERIFTITSASEKAYSQLATWTLPNYYNDTPDNMYYGRFRPSRFVFQKWCESYGGKKGSGDASSIYVDCLDPRLPASLIYGSFKGQKGETKYCYPTANCVKNGTRWESFPYFKKYYDPKYCNTAGYADLYVMRLAEVYLIAAEAAANLCSSPSDKLGTESISYINILLNRARHSTSNGSASTQPANWTSDGLDKDALIDRIFWERAFEMLGEQHEYFDTHRMGAKWFAEHVTKPANEFLFRPEQDDNGNVDGHRKAFYGTPSHGEGNIYPSDPIYVRKGLICPIPNDELVYNASLSLEDQNPSKIFWE